MTSPASLAYAPPVLVTRSHESGLGRVIGGVIFGAGLLLFVNIVVGALFLLVALVGAVYEIVIRRSDGRVLEIRPEGLVVFRDFFERHPDGVRIPWSAVTDVSMPSATLDAATRYLLVELAAAARSASPFDRFEGGRVRIVLMDTQPAPEAVYACIDSYRKHFAAGRR